MTTTPHAPVNVADKLTAIRVLADMASAHAMPSSGQTEIPESDLQAIYAAARSAAYLTTAIESDAVAEAVVVAGARRLRELCGDLFHNIAIYREGAPGAAASLRIRARELYDLADSLSL